MGTLLAANYGFAETPDWQHLFKGNSIYPLIAGGGLNLLLLGYLCYGIYQNRQIANGTSASTHNPSQITLDINVVEIASDGSYGSDSIIVVIDQNQRIDQLRKIIKSEYQNARVTIMIGQAYHPSNDNLTIAQAMRRGGLSVWIHFDT